MTLPLLIAFLGACLASGLIVRATRDVANRRSLLDHPNDRSSHSIPKPRLGGVGIMAPVLVLGVGLIAAGHSPRTLLVPLGATGCIALLGLVDDLRPLPARVRFAVQVALASLVVATSSGRLIAGSSVLGGLLPGPVVAALSVVWIVWLTNLYNFMDGIDGLAGSQALVASLGLMVVAVGLGSGASGWLLASLAGSSLGFLLFNFPPSSIFMGDVGATAIGFFFGALPLFPEVKPVPVELVALALSLFLLDATATLLRRAAAGEKWYSPHRTHLYQRPVALGKSHLSVTMTATGAMVIVAACVACWGRSSPAVRVALASVPLVLVATGHVMVGRMERAGQARARLDA